jgi:hypothetical protein
MPMRRILLMLSSLAAGGCASFNRQDPAPLQAASSAPEGKRLAELANAAFVKAKLTGSLEISPVRATHDSQWGEWVFCVRSGGADPSLRYAVLIGNDEVLEVRSSVLIDGCEQETYHPLAPAGAHVNGGEPK